MSYSLQYYLRSTVPLYLPWLSPRFRSQSRSWSRSWSRPPVWDLLQGRRWVERRLPWLERRVTEMNLSWTILSLAFLIWSSMTACSSRDRCFVLLPSSSLFTPASLAFCIIFESFRESSWKKPQQEIRATQKKGRERLIYDVRFKFLRVVSPSRNCRPSLKEKYTQIWDLVQ